MAIFALVYIYDVIHLNEQQYYLMIYYKKNKHFLIINWEQFDVLINHSQIKKIGQQI